MLIFEMRTIGNKLLAIRKKSGLTQAEVAEAAGLSDRTYADIERGSVNMRMETFLKICKVLHITPNDVLVDEQKKIISEKRFLDEMRTCTEAEKETALNLLFVYLDSLNK